MDEQLFVIPFESLDFFEKEQIYFLRVLNIGQFKKTKNETNNDEFIKKVCYLVNPEGDLVETQKRLSGPLKSQLFWSGWEGSYPPIDEIINKLKNGYSYLFHNKIYGTWRRREIFGQKGIRFFTKFR